MIYAKKPKLKIFQLNGISANFCCFIIGDLSLLLPEPVTNIYFFMFPKTFKLFSIEFGQLNTAVFLGFFKSCNVFKKVVFGILKRSA